MTILSGIILILIYILLPVYQTAEFLSRSLGASPVIIVDTFLAIGLYFWMLGNQLIALKIPVVQRAFPRDQRIRIHIHTSLAVLLSLMLHVLIKLIGGYFIDLLSWILLGVMVIVLGLAYYWTKAPGMRHARVLMIRLSGVHPGKHYDLLKFIHNWGLALATVLMYFHIREAGLPGMTSPLGSIMYTGGFITVMVLWIFAYIRRLVLPRGTVLSLKRAGDISILTLRPDRPIKYRPGQFAYIGLHDARGRERLDHHPFSFLSSPDDSSGTSGVQHGELGPVEFGIGHSGDFSMRLAELEPGSRVIIDPAYGDFRARRGRKTCAIGTGMGMVPVLSLAREYGSRLRNDSSDSQGSTAKYAGPKRTAGEPGDTGKTVFFLRGQDAQTALIEHSDPGGIMREKGILNVLGTGNNPRYISRPQLESRLGRLREWDFLICSSRTVRKRITRELETAGVPGGHIRFERFDF